ncbi:MAG: carbohydrate kinase [Pseudomonadota bacterium]
MTVLVCGEALWDLFAEEGPDGLCFQARLGGSPFNVAVGLARLGTDASLLTGLSTDPMGTRIRTALAREGIGEAHLVSTERRTTLSLVDLGPGGSPFYAFYGETGAERAVGEGDLPPALDPGIWALHAGSYSLVAEPVGSSLIALMRRERGRRLITVDPNVRPTVVPDLDLWRARVAEVATLADVLKISAEDLEILYPGAKASAMAPDWLAAGVRLVVVTRGGTGAEMFCRDAHLFEPAPAIEVVDTVGAGDSFMSALIAGLDRKDVRSAAGLDALDEPVRRLLLRQACAAAALTCLKRGANPPTSSELTAGLSAA